MKRALARCVDDVSIDELKSLVTKNVGSAIPGRRPAFSRRSSIFWGQRGQTNLPDNLKTV
jgi:hypothetical protein